MKFKVSSLYRIFFIFCFLFFISSNGISQKISYPKADKIPYTTFIHGDTLRDNYFWLRDKYSAEVVNYLYANNGYANEVMKSSSVLQKVLYDEFRGRTRENFKSRPVKNKNYYYYTSYVQDMDYPFLWRKKDSLNAPSQLVMDLNKLAKEFVYFNIETYSVSPDQSMVAYGVDTKGNHVQQIFIKNIDRDSLLTNEQIPEALEVFWSNDNKTIYYTVPEPKTLRPYRVYKHSFGTSAKTDELIFEELDKTFEVGMARSSSKNYLFINSRKTKSDEIWFLNANKPDEKPKLFCKRKQGLTYDLNHFEGNEFYLLTNYQAKNNQLMKAPVAESSPDTWQPVIPAKENRMIDNYVLVKDFMIWQETENANSDIFIQDRRTANAGHTLLFPGSNSSVGFSIEDYDFEKTRYVDYSFVNMVKPLEITRLDLYTNEKSILDRDSLNVPYDSDKYESKRLFAPSHDGVLVPMTIAFKKGIVLNGNNPVLIEGYGSYGVSSFPAFNPNDISYMNRGFIIVQTHVRGGKELGEMWYETGKMSNKKNTFLDFIACAEYLVKEKYTHPDLIAATGGSAGGLLMGAVLNMRPDLFKCVVPQVPFVDVINTMLDETLPLTMSEFEEWGNPKIKKEFDYMKSYSPYDNVKAQNYPDILLTAGYNDSQVGYWEPAKFAAKLREMKTDTSLLLLKTNMDAGHGGSSGRYNQLKDEAFVMAFIMRYLGIQENYITIKGKVIDEHNEPVLYANVYFDDGKTGTTTNAEGEFELKMKEADKTNLYVQSLGFEKQKTSIDFNSRTVNLVIRLKSENILLKTLVVKANAKDPAYAIIKEAIRHRKENNEKVKSFSADVYMKSNVRLLELPKNLPKFLKISTGEGTIDSSDIGLIYLSESVAKFATEKPDKVKEQMIASKVAGEKQGFSWNRVEDVFVNFYDPSINMEDLTDRPFLSPIAPLAMLSYKYKYVGNFFADNIEISKIQVIPMRKGDPLFQGYIYIAHNDFQVYGVDLMITKDANISFVDTMYISQEKMMVDSIWMPLQMKISSHIKVFGIMASDMSLARIDNYKLNKGFPKDYFNYEVFSVEKNANKKDTSYWASSRTVILTEEEDKHYHKADSIFTAHNTPHYLDSMDHVRNKFKFGAFLLSGYTYSKQNDSLRRSFSTNALPFTIGFNTVEGVFVNYSLSWRKYFYYTRNSVSLSPVIRYGFANENFAGGLIFNKRMDAKTGTSLRVSAGRFVEQFNPANPINSLVNSQYTLLLKENYAKLLQKDLLGIRFQRELFNGLYSAVNIKYLLRSPMVNHSSYTWSKRNWEYTSNNPLDPANDSPAFLRHQSAELAFSVRYVPKQAYQNMPDYKFVYPSKYPDIYLTFKQGIGTDNIKFNYQFLEAGTGKDVDLNMFGKFSFDVTAGTFFNHSNMTFADYKHFNGNQTVFLYNPENLNSTGDESRERHTSFYALDYYTYSTNSQFFELHGMQNFKGFLLQKMPLLRKLKAHEITGINFLATSKIAYNEYYVGLGNIFNVLRVDAGRVTSSGKNNQWFFRIGLATSF